MKKRNVALSLLFFTVVLFLVSCGGKNDKKKETTTTPDSSNSVNNIPAETAKSDVKLFCINKGEDSLGTPHFNVMLSVNGKEFKIKTINGCGDIPLAEYKTYDIPAEAVSACGGWWAGAGDYYYVVIRNGKPSLFEGWMDETQKEPGRHWKEIPYN